MSFWDPPSIEAPVSSAAAFPATVEETSFPWRGMDSRHMWCQQLQVAKPVPTANPSAKKT
jgi:hypothetical protein